MYLWFIFNILLFILNYFYITENFLKVANNYLKSDNKRFLYFILKKLFDMQNKPYIIKVNTKEISLKYGKKSFIIKEIRG